MIYFTKFMRSAGATCMNIAPKRIFSVRLLISVIMTRRFTDPPYRPDNIFAFKDDYLTPVNSHPASGKKKRQPDCAADALFFFNHRLPM